MADVVLQYLKQIEDLKYVGYMTIILYTICMQWLAVYTVVWKILVWNYFIVENVRENNLCGLPILTKIF